MTSIGPALPPHLQHKHENRDQEQDLTTKPDASPPLPPQLQGPEPNAPKGLQISPSSEDQARDRPVANTRSIGPALPPHLAKHDRSGAEEEPSPEPPSKRTRTSGPLLPPHHSTSNEHVQDSPRHPIHGPAPPPAPLDQRPAQPPNVNDSDDEDDYGPTLPGSLPTQLSNTKPDIQRHTSQHWDKHDLPQPEVQLPKHDDWMTMPPVADDLVASMDPTKIRARKFNSKSTNSSGTRASWIETPEQKRQRLENEVLGIAPAIAGSAKPGAGPAPPPEPDGENEVRKKAGPSLYEMHKSERRRGKGEDADDPAKRAFDWEKDMNVGGRVSHKQKRELLNGAKNFGGRFSKGQSL